MHFSILDLVFKKLQNELAIPAETSESSTDQKMLNSLDLNQRADGDIPSLQELYAEEEEEEKKSKSKSTKTKSSSNTNRKMWSAAEVEEIHKYFNDYLRTKTDYLRTKTCPSQKTVMAIQNKSRKNHGAIYQRECHKIIKMISAMNHKK